MVFGVAMWFALRQSAYGAVDTSLRDRVHGVSRFIQEQGGSLSTNEIRDEFREHSVLGPGGDLFQVADSNGNWIYRSTALYEGQVAIASASELGPEGRFENFEIQQTPLRLFSRTVSVHGHVYTVQVAASLSELASAQTRFLWALVWAIPAVLAAASLGGYWICRRALRPVDEISGTARSISAEDLSRRLPVPATDDELQRLTETLNDMMGRLEGAFAKVTQFTADASHELRTPLALIRTTAELALRRHRSDSDYRDSLAAVLKEAERTSQLVEDLLLLARADAQKHPPSFRRINLVESLRETCAEAATLAEIKQVTFRFEPCGQPVAVAGDGEAMRRLCLILIDNAIKYTPEGGAVDVAITRHNGRAVIEVKDSGIGISQQDLPHIFERFYRADKARNRERGGTGLGLAIARWIVTLHKGEIQVDSMPGQGSIFRVHFPLTE
jgi:heavy metal sensor kinase